MARTKARTWRQLRPPEQRRLVELREQGKEAREVALIMRCSERTVERTYSKALLARRRGSVSELRLSFEEREQISRSLAEGKGFREIARELGRSASTVSREVGGRAGRREYRALSAHRRSLARLERPRPGKLARNPRLRGEVEARLVSKCSPEQISARLRIDFPSDPEMRVSHETIYRSLYIQSKGELRRQLTANLRFQRSKRKPRGAGLQRRGRIRDMVPISERPPEVDDRRVPGHWEGDLLVGKRNASFIATLVERQSRYVMLARLGSNGTTEHVIDALKARIRDLPRHLLLSLTWDQGIELAAHRRLSAETGIDVYFCDPHSPWQRGSNENTNGLLRQYLPKGGDLAEFSQVTLDEIAAELNGRPRKTLGWATPAEKMEELLR